MNRYRIMKRSTKDWWGGEANSAQEACQLAGWVIGDCWVRVWSPRVEDPTSPWGYSGGGWKTERKQKKAKN